MSADASLLVDTADALWPPPHRIDLTRWPQAATPGAVDLLVLPRARTARWLVPASQRAASAALLRSDPSARNPVGARLLARAHHLGLLRWLPVQRIRVHTPIPCGGALDGLMPASDPQVVFAVRLGVWKYPRSVVVRLFTGVGETIAYAKLGLNPLGSQAVTAEQASLRRVAELGLRNVQSPTMLHSGQRHGMPFVTFSALAPVTPTERGYTLPLDAMAELGRTGQARTGQITDSAWFTGLGARIDEVKDTQVRGRLLRAKRALDGTAGSRTRVRLGPWHGDWTRWNMAWDGDRVLLWDWEHFAEDVPVGADALHFRAQQLRVVDGNSQRGEAQWWEEAPSLVTTMPDVVPESWPLVVTAYLLEVNLRYVLDRQDTLQAREVRQGWGLPLLQAASDQLGSRCHP